MKEVTVTLRLVLDEEEQEKLAEYVALRREYDVACFPGRQYPKWCYTEEESLRHILSVAFLDDVLNEAIDREKRLLKHRQEIGPIRLGSELDEEAGDVPARNPSPEEATPEEAETVSNGEEEASARTDEEPETPPQLIEDRTDEYFNYLEHGTMPEDSHETLIPVIDADGVHRMATLDEVEDMREAAQGIYNGAPPEPKEPENFRDKGYLYDPAHYEGDACECGSIVVSDPESLAFVDALFEALYR